MKRAIIVVLDGVGVGELPDASLYGDEGSNTLGNISRAVNGLKLTNMEKLGLGKIPGAEMFGVPVAVTGAFGRNAERSPGKDTTTGHWEMAGVTLTEAFPTYPDGFPEDVISAFEQAIGVKTIANEVASGTEIIQRLGEEHVKTGYPIVYTSADSVFQIAAHEEVVPLEQLYYMCRVARNLLVGKHAVGRVIARPFQGKRGTYERTGNRRDFAINPPAKTLLDIVKEAGLQVRGIGKIDDIFNARGITHSIHTHGNQDGIDRTLLWLKEEFEGVLFVNLIDFDMHFGHRNDVAGFAAALSEFDLRLPEILSEMKQGDLLFITGDHGCDPTTPSTDHSREYTPLLVAGKTVTGGKDLGTRKSFGDIAATALDWLGIKPEVDGESFLELLTK